MKRLLTFSLLSVAVFALTTPPHVPSRDSPGPSSPQQRCGSLREPRADGARVVSVSSVVRTAGQVAQARPSGAGDRATAVCEVTVVLTHPGVGERARTHLWLPLKSWNGRFQVRGGGGFSARTDGRALADAVGDGYAAATTDAGAGTNEEDPSSWALDDRDRVDAGLLKNFAERSLHETAVVGKQLTGAFYGRQRFHSYWNGCSTGGRQGWMAAQRHPRDFDGIVAAAPAGNWDRFVPAGIWPQVVMEQSGNRLSACELHAFTKAAVAKCDPRDGAADGIVQEPGHCRFDPRTLAGKRVRCRGERPRISTEDARVVARIWQGPTTRSGKPLWYGPDRSAPLTGLAASRTAADGTPAGAPLPLSANWIRYFLRQDPDFDLSQITYREFERLFRQSQRQYHRLIGTDDPDLREFAAAGGKMVTWHGGADQLIPPEGTLDYRRRVARVMGGAQRTDSFFRVFLAPGVGHCGGGNGPVPRDPLSAVVQWVEHGRPPGTLPAATASEGTPVTRNLCRYPLHAHYTGHGPPSSARSHTCRR